MWIPSYWEGSYCIMYFVGLLVWLLGIEINTLWMLGRHFIWNTCLAQSHFDSNRKPSMLPVVSVLGFHFPSLTSLACFFKGVCAACTLLWWELTLILQLTFSRTPLLSNCFPGCPVALLVLSSVLSSWSKKFTPVSLELHADCGTHWARKPQTCHATLSRNWSH